MVQPTYAKILEEDGHGAYPIPQFTAAALG
jgi:hypothetical protein